MAQKPKHEHEVLTDTYKHFEDSIEADPGQGPYAMDRRMKESLGAGTDWCPECRRVHPEHRNSMPMGRGD